MIVSKRNFFVLFLFTACFVWAIANIAEAGKPFCGDGICKQNKENSCNCPSDCGPPLTTEENCSDGTDNDCDELIDCDDQDCVAVCDLSPFCGDLECNGDETCSSCEADCGVCPPPSELLLVLGPQQPDSHDGDAVRAVGFATDGAGKTWIVSGGEDAHLRYWNLQLDDPPQRDLPLNHTIYDLDVDGSIVVTGEGGWNGHANSDTLRISDAEDFLVGTQAPIGFVYCVAISPDNLWTVASGFYGDIVVYETNSLELYATKATKKKRTKALAFSPDGSVLASTSTAGRIQLWSFPEVCTSESCELDLLPVSLSHSGSWSFPIAFSPNSTPDVIEIVSGTEIDLTGAEPDVSVLSVDSRAVYCLAWSPEDEDSKIVAGGDGDITVYDAGTLEILSQNVNALNAHAGRVNDVVFSPDSSQIVSGGADGALKLWDLVAQ
jgi:WD40 repeat protein